MSVASFIRNTYNADDEQQGRGAVFGRMLLILFGGAVVTVVVAGLMFGVASLIWGGTIVSIVQQIAGI